MNSADTARRAALVVLAVLGLLYAVVSLTWPLGWDQGILAWVGSVVAAGGLPFADAWDAKGPASYVPFALVSAVAGPSPAAYRLLEVMLLASGAGATALLVRAAGYPRAAVFAGLGLVLTQPSLGFSGTMQPDQWAGWLLTGAIAVAVAAPPALPFWSLSGVLVGIAVLIKPQFGLLGLVILLAAWRENPSRRASRIAATLIGGALPVVACVGWFVYAGAGPSLIDGYLVANLDARTAVGGEIIAAAPGLWLSVSRLSYVIPLAGAAAVGLAVARRQSTRLAGLLTAWLALVLAGVLLQGRWFTYQWTPLLPALLVPATIGLAHLWRGTVRDQVAAGLFSLASLSLALAPLFGQTEAATARLSGQLGPLRYLDHFQGGGPNYRALPPVRAAQYAAHRTRRDDCVLSWPEPLVNVLAERRTPSRFASVAGLTRYSGARWNRNREEFLDALERRAPALVLIDAVAMTDRPEDLANLTIRFPALVEWIRARYDSTDQIAKYTVWEPKSPSQRNCGVR